MLFLSLPLCFLVVRTSTTTIYSTYRERNPSSLTLLTWEMLLRVAPLNTNIYIYSILGYVRGFCGKHRFSELELFFKKRLTSGKHKKNVLSLTVRVCTVYCDDKEVINNLLHIKDDNTWQQMLSSSTFLPPVTRSIWEDDESLALSSSACPSQETNLSGGPRSTSSSFLKLRAT